MSELCYTNKLALPCLASLKLFQCCGRSGNQTETFGKGCCVSGDPVGGQNLLFLVSWREMEGWKWACSCKGFRVQGGFLRIGLIMAVFRAGGNLASLEGLVYHCGLMIEMFAFTRAVGKGLRAQVEGFILLMMSSPSYCETSGKQ